MKKESSQRSIFYRAFLPMLGVFLLPIIAVVLLVFALPPVYDNTFIGELSDKYDRLNELDSPKIVVVAGSSAAFGLDSGMITEKLGYETVNFGLYANLGTKLMMDLSKSNIGEGDLIILAPEMNSQTLSLYFNPETAAQALDGSFYMLKDVDSGDYEQLIGAMWKLAAEKLNYTVSGTRPQNAGAYRKENFNEYGDNVFDRPYNEMSGFGNSIVIDFRTDPADGVTTEYEEYIDYVNEYVAYARERGAEVYFSFPPMNEDAVYGSNTDEQIVEFYKNLVLSLDCKVISNIYDYILDDGYFFDSEFHLNNSGVTVRTVQLIDDIKRELRRDDITVPLSELPEPAGKRPDCDDFVLIKLSDRSWAISGLTVEGRKKAYLVIPDEVNGYPVTTVLAGAFDDCDEAIICTLGKNIKDIRGGAVENAENLVGLVIPDGVSPESLSLPESGLGSGCATGFSLYVPPEKYDSFLAAKNLSDYSGIIVPDESFEYNASSDRSYCILVSVTESGRMRTELTIPDEWNGMPVRIIDIDAFAGAEKLEKLTLGKNVTEISSYAFSDVRDGLEVYIPTGVSVADIDMPDDPSKLGAKDLKIYVDWQEYDEALLSGYADVITTDNLYMRLTKADDGSWTVSGVNERGRELEELTIPDTVGGLPVRTVAANAFSGTEIKTLTLGGNISRIDGGALRGSKLTSLIIPDGRGAGDISVPNSMSESLATDGCRQDLRIYVDAVLYEEYAGDYFWGDYAKYLTSKQ